MHKHARSSPPTKLAVYTFSASPSSNLWKVNKNQMSVGYVGEMVHNKENRETGHFNCKKTEMAIPHQAFTCVMHTHKNRVTFAFVSISLLHVSWVIRVKLWWSRRVAEFEVTRYSGGYGAVLYGSGFLLPGVSYNHPPLPHKLLA